MIPFIVTASSLAYLVIGLAFAIRWGNKYNDSFLGMMLGLCWGATLPLILIYDFIEYMRIRPARIARKNRAKDFPSARVV